MNNALSRILVTPPARFVSFLASCTLLDYYYSLVSMDKRALELHASAVSASIRMVWGFRSQGPVVTSRVQDFRVISWHLDQQAVRDAFTHTAGLYFQSSGSEEYWGGEDRVQGIADR